MIPQVLRREKRILRILSEIVEDEVKGGVKGAIGPAKEGRWMERVGGLALDSVTS